MTDRLNVTTSDGKYTVIQEATGNLRFRRHGEPWPAADAKFAHVGLILALAQDLEDARGVAVELGKEVDELRAAGRAERFALDWERFALDWERFRAVLKKEMHALPEANAVLRSLERAVEEGLRRGP